MFVLNQYKLLDSQNIPRCYLRDTTIRRSETREADYIWAKS